MEVTNPEGKNLKLNFENNYIYNIINDEFLKAHGDDMSFQPNLQTKSRHDEISDD